MALSLQEIHPLEIAENYPSAINELEARITEGAIDPETVTRLGFNLWYAVVEALRLDPGVPIDHYRSRFMELLREFELCFGDNSDFCWAFGLGLSLFPQEFEGASELMGEELLERAAHIDAFYPVQNSSQSELAARFSGRGIFESYYFINESQQAGGHQPPTRSEST